MGQIIGGAAKPKRCNLNKLSQLETPAAGEYILVSSDNSMNAAGQGNFDCYIEGDGQKAATALELKSLVDDGAFDISAYRATGNVLAKYVDLSAALDGGNNIPKAFRKGGISVKFVQSSDNNYVQYRLMSDTFNTTPANWQGVDDEPTAGSNNLVESGGVYKSAVYRGTLPTNEYVNKLGIESGVWFTTRNDNLPFSNNALIIVRGITNFKVEIAYNLIKGIIYTRSVVDNNWTAWKTTYNSYTFYKRTLDNSIDIDNYSVEGFYYLNNVGGTLPENLSNKTLLLSINGTGNFLEQTLYNLNDNVRYYRSRTASLSWRTWSKNVVESDISSFLPASDIVAAIDSKASEIYTSIFGAIGNFSLKTSDSSIVGGFSPTGEAKTTTLHTYFYNVEEGEILKLIINNFSSSGFSVIQAWNGESFVESIVNSPTKTSTLYYQVPQGVNKIGCTYFTNNIYTLERDIDDLSEQVQSIDEDVTTISDSLKVNTRNIWQLNTNISFRENTVFGVAGTTLIPEGTYILSFGLNLVNNTSIDLFGYYSSGNVVLLNQIGTQERYCQKIVLENDVERLFFKFHADRSGQEAYLTNIQLEVLDWNGYSSSPEKGTWKELPYGTSFIKQELSLKEYIDTKKTSNWTGKIINYNGDSVTQGIGTIRTGWVKVVNQMLMPGKVNNYAIGGTRLAHVNDVPNCMVDRYQDMSLDCDLVVIMANTNDYASQVPIGSNDSQDPATYNGALNIIFTWLKASYPTQPVIISTMLRRKINYDSNNQPLPITIEQYAEAVRLKTIEYGFILYDAYNLSGLDQRNTPKDGTGISDDGLHPNVAGALALGRKLAAFINAQ